MTKKKISIRDDHEEIDFPKSEHPALKKRLDESESIYTTRTRDEKGEYTVGQLLDSPFGLLEVADIDTYSSIDQHPFKKDLTDEQKERIKGKSFDLIELVLASDN